MKTIKFTYTKTGSKRAYIWYPRSYRWLPISLANAELMLATDEAVETHVKMRAGA